jgi:hypothetical protein
VAKQHRAGHEFFARVIGSGRKEAVLKPVLATLTVLLASGTTAANQAVMNEFETLWKSKRISSYAYTLQRGMCPAQERKAVVYKVTNSILRSAQYVDGSGDVRISPQHPGTGTIEALFRLIERTRSAKFNVNAEYDPVHGFPAIITAWIPGMHDAGFKYTVTNFRVLR